MGARSYAVIGVGAVGGWYGSRLALAGHAVHWVARSEREHLAEHGLVVDHPGGRDHLQDLRMEPDGHPDVVLVCTKSTADVGALVASIAGPDSLVVAMQNGFGVEATLAAAVPGRTVLGAMCFTCDNRVGPGHVRHLDYGRVTLGERRADGDAAGITQAVDAVADDLVAAGVPVTREPDLERGRWKKLVWNIPYNGLSVVLDASTHELMADPATRSLAADLMGEVVAASVSRGHAVDAGFVDAMLTDTVKMAPYATSMKLDYDAGRPLEIAAIYDAPLAAARGVGCEMPRTAALAAQLHFLDRRAGAG